MMDRPDDPEVRHETSDVNIRVVLGFGLGLIVVAFVLHVGIWLLFMAFANREAHQGAPEFPLAVGRQSQLPPEPRLQTNPRQDLKDLRAAEDAILDHYGWVDKSTGVVQIPIGEAMKLAVERGLPARSAGEKKP
jgi:cytoskeletal protein RodZ